MSYFSMLPVTLLYPSCPSNYHVGGVCVPQNVSPLEFYVRQLDPETTYDPHPMQTLRLDTNATAFVLNLTSQRWMDDGVFLRNSSAGAVWHHQLSVVIPRSCTIAPRSCGPTAWLYVTGGHNRERGGFDPLGADDSDLLQAGNLAAATSTIGVVLKQVPNQPVRFSDELPHPAGMYPQGDRTEDGIIAYGWRQFLDQRKAGLTADARWLLRLPMTKAVSVAMDAVADFAKRRVGVEVRDFVVCGKSKRGWTTWTTGLVEPRARAIVPVVEDDLNLQTNIDRNYMALGGFTFEFADYIAAGVVGGHTAEFDELEAIVDPYAYLAGRRWKRADGSDTPWLGGAMPKLVVNAGNDEFFLPGDNHAWWGSVPNAHLLHLPNADHGFEFEPPSDAPQAFASSLLAFYRKVVSGAPRETFTWQLSTTLAAPAAPTAPATNETFTWEVAAARPQTYGLTSEPRGRNAIVGEAYAVVGNMSEGRAPREAYAEGRAPREAYAEGREPREAYAEGRAPREAYIVVGNMSSAPLRVSMWTATTTNGQRDWRLLDCRSGAGQNCTSPEGAPGSGPGGPREHPVPYEETVLSADVTNKTDAAAQTWTARVPVPEDGNFTAFVVDVRFASGERYTSQMAVAPDVYPYRPCGEDALPGGCGRMV